ncbi:MAG TPA: DUF1801 domain-containing protein [Candidatus Limnocylindrales bacterium]|nr:DUF1801 domain-containing protein [Candidatus Limnocylindrales bacterium]
MPHVGERREPLPGDGEPSPDEVEAAEARAAIASVDADVERLLAGHSAEIQAIEQALRVTIRSAFPAAVEQVDFGNKLIAFGRSMRMRGLLFAIIAHQSWVNLQLADGAELPDPEGLVEGTGKRIRHVKIRSVEGASSPAVVGLIEAQLAARPGD